MAPGVSMNPARTSANASTGRRGAWFSRRGGTQETLWEPPHSGAVEPERHPGTDRPSRTPSGSLRWLAFLIAIASAFIAVMLAMD
jgi:hypothetical protein